MLSDLRTHGKTEKIAPDNMVILYKSIVIPHLKYPAPVWQTVQCDVLDRVQMRGIAMCLGVPGTAFLEALAE